MAPHKKMAAMPTWKWSASSSCQTIWFAQLLDKLITRPTIAFLLLCMLDTANTITAREHHKYQVAHVHSLRDTTHRHAGKPRQSESRGRGAAGGNVCWRWQGQHWIITLGSRHLPAPDPPVSHRNRSQIPKTQLGKTINTARERPKPSQQPRQTRNVAAVAGTCRDENQEIDSSQQVSLAMSLLSGMTNMLSETSVSGICGDAGSIDGTATDQRPVWWKRRGIFSLTFLTI